MCLAPHINMAVAAKNRVKRNRGAATKRGNPLRAKATKLKTKKAGLKKKRDSAPVITSLACAATNASNQCHIPPHVPLGPYTVVRGRTVIPFTTNFTGQNSVFMFGQYGLISNYNSTTTPLIAVNGVGINVPGTTEIHTQDAVMLAYDSAGTNNALANAALHALTVNVACVSSATSATGVIYYGAVNQRVNRGQFATYNALALSAMTRREMSTKSAYNCMNEPVSISSYPVDIVDWASQRPFVQPNAVTLLDNSASDALAQMMVIFPPTAAAVEYIITVHSEWRVNFTDPALASTSSKREPTPQGVWDKAMDIGSTLGGKFEMVAGTVNSVAGGLGSLVSAYSSISNVINDIGAIAGVV